MCHLVEAFHIRWFTIIDFLNGLIWIFSALMHQCALIFQFLNYRIVHIDAWEPKVKNFNQLSGIKKPSTGVSMFVIAVYLVGNVAVATMWLTAIIQGSLLTSWDRFDLDWTISILWFLDGLSGFSPALTNMVMMMMMMIPPVSPI